MFRKEIHGTIQLYSTKNWNKTILNDKQAGGFSK